MKKTILSLILATSLCSCGGSSSSSITGASNTGNFISTTVNLEQRFVYALNVDEGSVSGFVVASEEEGGGHDHAHGKVLAQHDHDHEGEEEAEGLQLQTLDSSPYTFAGAPPIDMAVDGEGRVLYLLDAAGNLKVSRIDGVTGLLSPQADIATGVTNPRLLRLSQGGDALAVLGDGLAVFGIDGEELAQRSFVLENTQGWTDVRLSGELGVGVSQTGAVGFRWLPGALIVTTPEVVLPGIVRGQVAYAEAGVFVVNTDDVSVSQMLQDEEDGTLSLTSTFALPEELTDPAAICSIFDGEDLLVSDSDSVVLLHPHEDELEEEGHAEIDQAPSLLFPVPESSFVLAAHAQGEGFHVLEVSEEGLLVLAELETEHGGVGAFGFAERFEQVTRTITP